MYIIYITARRRSSVGLGKDYILIRKYNIIQQCGGHRELFLTDKFSSNHTYHADRWKNIDQPPVTLYCMPFYW